MCGRKSHSSPILPHAEDKASLYEESKQRKKKNIIQEHIKYDTSKNFVKLTPGYTSSKKEKLECNLIKKIH